MWFASSLGQCAVHIGYGLHDMDGCSGFNGSHEDAIAVTVVCNDEVIISMAGCLREVSCLVGVHYMPWLCGGQEACVHSGGVRWWCWEEVGVKFIVAYYICGLGAAYVLSLCVQVAHGCGL